MGRIGHRRLREILTRFGKQDDLRVSGTNLAANVSHICVFHSTSNICVFRICCNQ